MKKAVVTGCAGFIGSALSRRLLDDGYEVIGVDCFTDNYDAAQKERNLLPLHKRNGFTIIRRPILDIDWKGILPGVDVVFHQAAMPGVRTSWGSSFQLYVMHNILSTQVLLEAAKEFPLKKFVYASSSSVYGVTEGSTAETRIPRPHSPYGVTKLAAEHLCHLYAANYGVPTVSLRYFTVYGPGQRPDMAFHQFIRAMLKGDPLTVYGDGTQTRDFTYVDDAVEANLKAIESPVKGEVYNIGGQSHSVLKDVIALMGSLIGVQPHVRYEAKQAGDPPHTWADIRKAQRELGYAPRVPLEEGLRREIEYIKELYS